MIQLAAMPYFAHALLVMGFLLIALLLILVILIQKPQGGGLSGAFGAGASSGQTAFGAKTGDMLTWLTVTIFCLFVLGAIGLNFTTRLDPNAVSTSNAGNTVIPIDLPGAEGDDAAGAGVTTDDSSDLTNDPANDPAGDPTGDPLSDPTADPSGEAPPSATPENAEGGAEGGEGSEGGQAESGEGSTESEGGEAEGGEVETTPPPTTGGEGGGETTGGEGGGGG